MSESEKWDVLKYIEENHSEEYAEIEKACTKIKAALLSALPALKSDVSAAVSTEEFDEVARLNNYCKQLVALELGLPEWIRERDCASGIEQPLVLVEDEPANHVDYGLYKVDSSQPHTMDEDFTNTKICAYDLNEETVFVASWQDALVKLSATLYEMDAEKLRSFLTDPSFKGNRIKYFDTVSTTAKTKQIPGTDLYVWINLSAVQIIRLMKKMLNSYGLADLVIYLRADYSSLH